MRGRQPVKQIVQLLLAFQCQQLVHLPDVFALGRVALFHIQHQSLEQIRFRVVPEMVFTLDSGILDNHIAKQLRHQFLPLDLRQAVPRIAVFGRYEVEHLDRVALVTEVRAGFFVDFTFGIGTDQGHAARRALEHHVDAKGARLFRAGRAVHGHVAVHHGVFRYTDDLAVQLPQNRAAVLADVWNKVEHALHFPFRHEARRAVGALVGENHVAVAVIFAPVAAPHFHYQNK